MYKVIRSLMALIAIIGLIALVGCPSDDDDDNTPTGTLRVTDATAAEADTNDVGVYELGLTNAPQGNVTVVYSLAGTATPGDDFTAMHAFVEGRLVSEDFATSTFVVAIDESGSANGTLTIVPVADSVDDDNETVIVRITSATFADGSTARLVQPAAGADRTVTIANEPTPAFSRVPSRDFDTLIAAGNLEPNGIWSDGTTMWVADDDLMIYAYNLATKERDASRDFDTLDAAGNDDPVGLWSDGTTMWVADSFDDKIFAYNLATKERDASRDFNTLDAAGNIPGGLWSDGTTMWVGDFNEDKIFAYNLATKERDASRDFDTLDAAGNNNPRGIWSDGTTMWVADDDDDNLSVKIFAYNLATKVRDASRDFDTLIAAGNLESNGLWSDGTTMWVADDDDSKIFAYQMPATSGGGGGADTTAPTFTVAPANGATDAAADADIVITASEAIRQLDDSAITGSNVDGLITLTENGASKDFDATIAGAVITIDPDSDFAGGSTVVVTLARVEDAAGNASADPAISASFTIDSAAPFERIPSRDFDTLFAAGNRDPWGIWSDGTTMWVSDLFDANIYAYNLATKAPDAGKDFDTLDAAGNDAPQGIWSDGTTMWVADFGDEKIFAYNLATKAPDAGKDFDTLDAAFNDDPRGLWSDGTTMWVADFVDDRLYAYNLATTERDASRDFNRMTLRDAGNFLPRGLWSDGTTMWVVDSADDKIFAYNLATKARVESRDFDTLIAAGNNAPGGLWSDGTTMWVADAADDKIYAYQMPATSGGGGGSDTTAPTFTVAPANGATDAAADADIVITASEAIRQLDDSAITGSNVDDLITLTENGASKDFDATIAGAVITIDPDSDFAGGSTVVVTLARVEDAAGNASADPAISASFTVVSGGSSDTTAPTFTVAPANGATDAAADADIVITASEAIRQLDDSAITGSNVDGLITLTENGASKDFDATIAGAVITIDPDSNFAGGSTVVVTLARVEDAAGNASADPAISASFTIVSGGSSGSPDLIVESPSVDDSTLTVGQSFTLSATVRNRGTGSAAGTTLRWYRSTNSIISDSDTEVGTDSVSTLAANGTSAESISLTAPSEGTYYYGACVNIVTGESDTGNNCSTGVMVTVTVADDYPGDSSSTGSVSVGGSVTGEIETSGDEDWFRVSLTAGTVYQFDLESSPTSMGTLSDTILELYGTDGSTRLEFNDDGGIGLNSRITYTPTTSGTYYLAARGFSSNTGTYTLSVSSDTAAPTFTVAPANGATDAAADADIVITASEAIRQLDDSAITGSNVDDLITLTENGASKDFDATIAGAVITIDPDSNFAGGSTVVVTLARVEDAAGNASADPAISASFTIVSGGSSGSPFEQIPSRDFNTLQAAGNNAPLGLWSDGTTMWVSDIEDAKIYAYNLSTKARDAGRDFDTLQAADNTLPTGIWSDGTTMWVADRFGDSLSAKIFAYNLATKARDASRDFDTLFAAGNTEPLEIWSDGTTMWVTDDDDDVADKIFAYNLATKARDASSDFDTLDAAGNNASGGLWSDGTTMWVGDFDDAKIFAYNLSTKARDASRDFDTLQAAGNEGPTGIWSDGTTMWVADPDDDKIYAYQMP